MGYYSYGYGFDPTYILVVIGAVICLAASGYVKLTFARYAKVRSRSGLTGELAAERIRAIAGIQGLAIRRIGGNLTDHYDSRTKTVSLSDPVYGSDSIAAIAVAAHECGHAIQDQRAYVPLRLRHAIVPVANIGSGAAWPLIIIGAFIGSGTGTFLIQLGIWAFSLAVVFQLVTLPVELNASRRALAILRDSGMVPQEELSGARKVLRAAALTYVASAAAAILQLLRLMILFGGKNDD